MNHSTNAKIRFARTARRAISIISGGLVIFFGWLQLKDFQIDVDSVLNATAPSIIWHSALVLNFLGWTLGTKYDTDIQELVIEHAPNEGRWPIHAFGMLALLAIAAAALCWAVDNIERFAIVLTCFMIVDHIGWRILIGIMKPAFSRSDTTFKNRRDTFARERLRLVVYQIQGSWKLWRLGIGAVIVLIFDALAVSDSVRNGMATAMQLIAPNFLLQDSVAFAASLLVFFFVLTMESWHWWMRFQTKTSIKLLDELETRYRLSPTKS